jgi:hypothetical protein
MYIIVMKLFWGKGKLCFDYGGPRLFFLDKMTGGRRLRIADLEHKVCKQVKLSLGKTD